MSVFDRPTITATAVNNINETIFMNVVRESPDQFSKYQSLRTTGDKRHKVLWMGIGADSASAARA